MPESWRHQGSRNRRTNCLARAGLRKNDVPEVYIGIDEGNSHESPFALFAQGGHNAIHRMGCVFVENLDSLSRNQRRVHEDQGTVGADDMSRRLQVDGFTFGQTAAHCQRYLKRKARGTPTFWITSSLHNAARRTLEATGRNIGTFRVQKQAF